NNEQTTLIKDQDITNPIIMRNLGPGRLLNAQLTDNFPASLQNVTWTAAGVDGGSAAVTSGNGNITTTVNLPIFGAVVFNAQATVTPSAPGVVDNSASVELPPGMIELNPGDNQASDVDSILH